jgi:hypothetical protein
LTANRSFSTTSGFIDRHDPQSRHPSRQVLSRRTLHSFGNARRVQCNQLECGDEFCPHERPELRPNHLGPRPQNSASSSATCVLSHLFLFLFT